MAFVTTKDGVNIYYKDWGPKEAQPIVFHHGWPLSADDWDNQMLFFLAEGYRVIAIDRRGHGRSDQVSEGHIWIIMRPMRQPWLKAWICTMPCTSVTPPAAARSPAMLRSTASRKARRQSGARQRRPASDGQNGDESRRNADRGLRRLPQSAGG